MTFNRKYRTENTEGGNRNARKASFNPLKIVFDPMKTTRKGKERESTSHAKQELLQQYCIQNINSRTLSAAVTQSS